VNREVFEAALRDDWNDLPTRLVYADWLDENGYPDEAELQRQWPQIQAKARRYLDDLVARYSPYENDVDEAGNVIHIRDGARTHKELLQCLQDHEGFYSFGTSSNPLYDPIGDDTPEELWKNIEILLGPQFVEQHREDFSWRCSC
jgi:uncharacterized protein (TIGR02996 family)